MSLLVSMTMLTLSRWSIHHGILIRKQLNTRNTRKQIEWMKVKRLLLFMQRRTNQVPTEKLLVLVVWWVKVIHSETSKNITHRTVLRDRVLVIQNIFNLKIPHTPTKRLQANHQMHSLWTEHRSNTSNLFNRSKINKISLNLPKDALRIDKTNLTSKDSRKRLLIEVSEVLLALRKSLYRWIPMTVANWISMNSKQLWMVLSYPCLKMSRRTYSEFSIKVGMVWFLSMNSWLL